MFDPPRRPGPARGVVPGPTRPPLTARLRTLSVALLVASGAGLGSEAAAQDAVRRCAVEDRTAAEVARTTAIVERRRALGAFRPALRAASGPVVVPVAVHVLTSGGAGASDDRVEAQLDVLRAAFDGLGYRLVVAAYERVENPAWAGDLDMDSPEEAAMKRALALDPTAYLNLYVADVLFDDFLGWATLPDEPEAGTALDGVVVGASTLPGGRPPFDEGDTAVHEVGHWLGLEHPWAGFRCAEPNDGVADTPQQRSPVTVCDLDRDSCPNDPGTDPVQNFMGYAPDACMTRFTPGQRERMEALTAELRPAVAQGGRVLAAVARTAFDAAFAGVTQTAPLRIVNTTGAPVTVTAVTASDAAFAVGGVGQTVAPGGVAVLDLAFTPSAPGDYAATVIVETDGPGAVPPVQVTATATLPPVARLASGARRVEAVEGDSVTVAVTITNEGGAALQFAVEAAPPWVVFVEPDRGALAPGASATLAVTVATDGIDVPAGARRREVEGVLALATNDPLRPALAVPLVAVVSERPEAFAVGAPFPNPGRGRITVPLAFPDAAEAVTVEVYDALGRRVAVLAQDAPFPAGFSDLVWDAGAAPAGLYLVQARAPGGADVARVVVAR